MKGRTLGERMRILRKERRLSQANVASKIGVSASAVGMYEQNRRTPDNETLLKLCEVLGVTADCILGNDESTSYISEVLDEFTRKLAEQDALMFDGQPLSSDEKRQILEAINAVARCAERLEYEE